VRNELKQRFSLRACSDNVIVQCNSREKRVKLNVILFLKMFLERLLSNLYDT